MTNPYHPHNHRHCIEDALQEARSLCKDKGARLTPLREKVLELVWQSHSPIGAYDILAELGRLEERSAQPPTVYRALDFLMEHGLIHRLSSLNAFIGCSHPSEQHNSCFLICEKCHVAQEIEHPSIDASLKDCAQSQGFKIIDSSIELTGLCPNCVGANQE
ncbi:Fur family transcriptional regulator [Endozoicomonas sp. OPT23]|uniref:Fur family transcriptional regulator n=1 Tax=Endozoicomonas sp. OPT23 TaxID=2072845 RepID=UPI00129B6EBB|nr:Fur family transcriptional regulator [Endozoicomonas sp. OPT23]MRI33332.1 Fur family transcriptional regulator [Endozoicomonas sp. OPT23]